MNLYVGLKLRTINNDVAEIIEVNEQNIKLLYQGKKITISKKQLYKCNIKLFVVDKPRENTHKVEKNNLHDTIEDESKKFVESCKNCMEFKNGNCIGYGTICCDYRPSPEISKEEIARWPKEGDATYYRTRKFARR